MSAPGCPREQVVPDGRQLVVGEPLVGSGLDCRCERLAERLPVGVADEFQAPVVVRWLVDNRWRLQGQSQLWVWAAATSAAAQTTSACLATGRVGC